MDDIESRYRDKKVLITGGAGFIGSNLARRLVGMGANVTIVDSMITDYGGNLFNLDGILDKVHLNISDVRDRHGLAFLVQGQDYLFNLAGQVSHIDSMKDPFTDLAINAESQLAILEVCRKENPEIQVVFASTRQVYGKPVNLPVSESHPLKPPDVNGINKLAGEQYHRLYSDVFGIHCCCLRLTNCYGPRQLMKHNRQGVVYWFMRQIMLGEKIRIFGTGEQKRDLNYVDDVVDALLLAGSRPEAFGQIYNVGADEAFSLKHLVELMIEVYGGGEYEIVPFPPERKKIDIGDFQTDYTKIHDELGWRPKTDLRDGMAATFEYYRKHGDKYWS